MLARLLNHPVAVGAMLLVATVGLWLAVNEVGPTLPLMGAITLFALVLLLWRPQIGTIIFFALAYGNVVALLGIAIGSPMLTGAAASALLALPAMAQILAKKRGVVLDRPFLGMLVFMGCALASSFVAKDSEIAFSWVITYLTEGILLYFLITNAIRSLSMLRAVVWTLFVVCGLLGAMSVYQELSGDHDQTFGGLAHRNTERGYGDGDDPSVGLGQERETVLIAHRAQGPVGDPNRYAQILIVLMPLALFWMLDEKKWGARIAAGTCLGLMFGGMVLSYSRGGFLALLGLTVIMGAMKYVPWKKFVLGFALAAVAATIVAPGYIGRVDTMLDLDRFSGKNRDFVGKKQGDGAVRGRITEMLAAMNVFLDYPILGVGPGQYSPHYSVDYMANPKIALKQIDSTRRAHSLFFELAAEFGVLGFTVFLGLAFVVVRRLRDVELKWKTADPALSRLAAALILGLLGYFGTATFLHLSFQRYYWIYLAICGAATHILKEMPLPIEDDDFEEGTPQIAAGEDESSEIAELQPS